MDTLNRPLLSEEERLLAIKEWMLRAHSVRRDGFWSGASDTLSANARSISIFHTL